MDVDKKHWWSDGQKKVEFIAFKVILFMTQTWF